MISVNIRSKAGRVQGFTVKNHGRSEVCAAVSLLTLNTVNSIEALTDESFVYDYNSEGGFLKWDREGESPEVDLLLNAMVFGLKSVEENYGNEIMIKDDNYD